MQRSTGRVFDFDPEYAWNSESSDTGRLFDNHLALSANVFSLDLEDQQIETPADPPDPASASIDNAAESYAGGFELEGRDRRAFRGGPAGCARRIAAVALGRNVAGRQARLPVRLRPRHVRLRRRHARLVEALGQDGGVSGQLSACCRSMGTASCCSPTRPPAAAWRRCGSAWPARWFRTLPPASPPRRATVPPSAAFSGTSLPFTHDMALRSWIFLGAVVVDGSDTGLRVRPRLAAMSPIVRAGGLLAAAVYLTIACFLAWLGWLPLLTWRA